jgi:hypothetical protein
MMGDVDRTCELASTEGRNSFSHCITCSDEAIEMTVVLVDDSRGLALCENEAGARSSVEIALIDPVAPGDTVLVHAGTALA